MQMLLVDLALALVVGLLLSWIFVRFVHDEGPWRRPWAFAVAIFLFAWAGGAWFAPGTLSDGWWLTYWIPFLVVGLVAALLIVTASPQREIETDEQAEQLRREQQAVLLSVTVLWWFLGATLIGLVVAAYLR